MLRVVFFVIAVLFPLAGQAAEYTIATFNAEFLTCPKVHIKFGLPVTFSDAPSQAWNAPGCRDQKCAEAAAPVADMLAGVAAGVLALSEIGDEADVLELRNAVAVQVVGYDQVVVCA